ncbi:MAG: hypothetical protein ABIJ45_03925 [Candidatus Zixiibacteriota bacterium]
MRNLIPVLIFIAFLFNPIPVVGSEWHQIPTGIKTELTGIHFIDNNYGFVVTKNGVVVRFDNKGSLWKTSGAKFQFDMEGIYFLPDGKTGFAYGTEGMVLRTTDSGLTWISNMVAFGTRFSDMVFLDSLTGLIVGLNYRTRGRTNGVVFKTTDGGLSWDSLRVDCWTPEAVTVSPEGTVLITGKKNLLITRDKGINWSKVVHPSLTTPKAAALIGKNGLMAGMSGFVAVSSDSGMSWSELNNIPQEISIFDIVMLDSSTYYMVGTEGEILYTNDGGQNWTPEASGSFYQLSEIMRAGDYLFSCGREGILIYTNLKEATEPVIPND